jgi:CubicO group peptidase (beta-lactamase class C family)
VDEGKLKWNDKVQDYIPEFAMYDPYVTKEFTVRDLLVHHSGLARGAGELMQDPSPTTFTTSDIIHSLRYFKPVSPFRTQFAYSNIMYIVAGELIARVSGMSCEEFISSRIFKPLQMDRSRASHHLIGENPNVIQPHAETNGAVHVVHRDDDQVADPAGGIFSSVDDMSQWVIMQMNDGKYGNGLKARLFSQAVHDEMWTPQTIIPVTGASIYNTHFGAYGLGWFLIDAAGYKEVFHTGGDTGISSNVVMPMLFGAFQPPKPENRIFAEVRSLDVHGYIFSCTVIIFHPQVCARSLNSGLIVRMRLSFFSRRQPLSCFSRAMAVRMSS